MQSQIQTKNKYCCHYKTAHYDFYFAENSLAQKEIEHVANLQENCYEKITSILKIAPKFRIYCLLANTPTDLGILYGDNEPCNGFARLPNEVYAVYNEKIKCIGMHEDAHIISYSVKKPLSAFLSEGLAMYFDEQYLGKSNIEWCKYFISNDNIPDIAKLLDNSVFYKLQESVSYPLAGAITKFFIDTLHIDTYLQDIYYNDNFISAINKHFNGLENMYSLFIGWLKNSF